MRIKIGEFCDRASELIRRAADGETVVILDRGRPVAKIVPVHALKRSRRGFLGALQGTARIVGDIESPIGRPDAWFKTGL